MTATAVLENLKAWQASLDLRFSKRSQKTVLTHLKHTGPLRVQRAFYPEGDVCHVYILHPPGGVVGSDILDVSVIAEKNSHALITTPGATKFYRSSGDFAYVTQKIQVEHEGTLEWFPQENIFFPGAKVKLKTQVDLASGAKFIGWDIQCLGRPVNQEIFDFGELDSALTIFRDNEPVLLERLRINENRQLAAAAGLRNYPMSAIFLCTSCNETHVEIARDIVSQLLPALPVGITLLDDILVLRILGFQTEPMQKIMIAVWRTLRPLILDKPVSLPRIWAT